MRCCAGRPRCGANHLSGAAFEHNSCAVQKVLRNKNFSCAARLISCLQSHRCVWHTTCSDTQPKALSKSQNGPSCKSAQGLLIVGMCCVTHTTLFFETSVMTL